MARKTYWQDLADGLEEDRADVAKRLRGLDERPRLLLEALVNGYASRLAYSVQECESPIEQMMYLALWGEAAGYGWRETEPFDVELQVEIPIPKHSPYRVDMVVSLRAGSGPIAKTVVECDGHDFHEKTKEQARKDKSRDRALQVAGYPVLRFTGSEIWARPYQCAAQVVNYLISIVCGHKR